MLLVDKEVDDPRLRNCPGDGARAVFEISGKHTPRRQKALVLSVQAQRQWWEGKQSVKFLMRTARQISNHRKMIKHGNQVYWKIRVEGHAVHAQPFSMIYIICKFPSIAYLGWWFPQFAPKVLSSLWNATRSCSRNPLKCSSIHKNRLRNQRGRGGRQRGATWMHM